LGAKPTDLGANGMGIPIGKLQLYTACAAVPPQYLLPMHLDAGTTNQALINDPLYLGLRQPRVSADQVTQAARGLAGAGVAKPNDVRAFVEAQLYRPEYQNLM
jgi:malic enzyme